MSQTQQSFLLFIRNITLNPLKKSLKIISLTTFLFEITLNQLLFTSTYTKGKYNGQVPIKLVITKTLPKATRIPPNIPDTIPVKNNKKKIIAINNLIILSVPPIFFFITSIYYLFIQIYNLKEI